MKFLVSDLRLPRDVNELRIFQRELTNFFYYEVKLKVNNLGYGFLYVYGKFKSRKIYKCNEEIL